MSKIIGITVGTPINPQVVIEKTALEERVDKLSEDIKGLKENGSGNVGTDFGGVEITDGEPTKSSTVMTLNPNAEEVQLYTAPEIDAMFDAFINAEEVSY